MGVKNETMSEKQLPRYQCHKIVGALKIKEVNLNAPDENGKITGSIVPQDAGYDPIAVSDDYISKHNPHAGGYYVVYKDGYESFSPAKAFEDGYELFVEKKTQPASVTAPSASTSDVTVARVVLKNTIKKHVVTTYNSQPGASHQQTQLDMISRVADIASGKVLDELK